MSAARGTYRLGISGMAGFGRMRVRGLILAFAAIVSPCGPARAIVGEAGPADVVIQRHTILVYSTKGRCSGVVLAPDLVLTAAHCVGAADGKFFVSGLAGAAIRADLRRRLVAPDAATAAVASLQPEAERLRRVLEGQTVTPALLRRLAGRGFSRDALEEVASSFASEA